MTAFAPTEGTCEGKRPHAITVASGRPLPEVCPVARCGAAITWKKRSKGSASAVGLSSRRSAVGGEERSTTTTGSRSATPRESAIPCHADAPSGAPVAVTRR